MSERRVAVPYFPLPPREYSPRYLAEVTRAFATYAQQAAVPGPQVATSLQLTPTGAPAETGVLTYNATEDTLDLAHLNGVVQQIGLEQFVRARNETGATITNGTVVGFAGVNGDITVSPFIANAAANELYFVGVTTSDIADGAVGMVTLYGKVRDVNTTGGAEGWSVGDIVYASPAAAGALTNVRPTAPDVVIPVAAVLTVGFSTGELLVRPTVPMGMDYGSFQSTTDQTISAINTPTPVTYDATLSSNGVTVASGSRLTVAQSGYYHVDANLQVTSNSSSAKEVYFWLAKNGAALPNTTRTASIKDNGGHLVVHLHYAVSLSAGDYVEVVWAGNDTDVALDALPVALPIPASPAALAYVSQIQL